MMLHPADVLTYAAPVGLACYGAVLSERSGVVQIALEGMMLIGALAAVIVASITNQPYLGLVAGMLAAALTAALHALFSLTMRSDHVIVGTAINFLSLGVTGVLSRSWNKQYPHILHSETLPPLLFGTNLVTLAFILLCPTLWYVLNRSRLGLRISASGELPNAVTAAGYSVLATRFGATIACGLLCGAAGAALSIGISNNFTDNMTASRGFVALALVVVARWSPIGCLFATLAFASMDVTQAQLQATGKLSIPYPILLAAPYICTLLALAFASKTNMRSPKYLGTNYPSTHSDP